MCKCCSWSDWIGGLTSKPPSDFHICSTSRFHIQETTPLLTSKSNCQKFNPLHWADLTDWEFHPTVISEARQQRTTMTSSLSVRELCCFSLSHNLINGHPEHPRIKFKKKRKHILFLFLFSGVFQTDSVVNFTGDKVSEESTYKTKTKKKIWTILLIYWFIGSVFYFDLSSDVGPGSIRSWWCWSWSVLPVRLVLMIYRWPEPKF